jgi:simple sugar transport system permease protein
MSFVADVSTGAVRAGSSVMLATYGEIISERAGIINLGVEGCMIAGACSGFIVAAETGSPYFGIVAAVLAGAAMASIHAFMVITRGANQLASGLALMFLGLGLTGYAGRPYVSSKIHGLNSVDVPLLSDIPFAGDVLFSHDILTYTAFLLGPVLWFFMFKTRPGLNLRAVGESTDAAFAAGLNPRLMPA